MHEATYETTTLIEIRDFLTRAGVAPDPWSKRAEAVERLYEILLQRRDDAAFWDDLSDLTARLEDRRFTPPGIRGSQVLGATVTEGLVSELRASLPRVNGEPRPLMEWIRSRVGVAALTGFLLLGAATGCSDEGEPCRHTAGAHGLSGEEAVVYDALVDVVDGAGLTHGERCTIYECLPELEAAAREALLDSFQMLSDQELSDQLQGLVEFCETQDDDDDDDCDDGCH